MKRRKSLFSAILVLSLLFSLAAGCSGGGQSTPSAPSSPSAPSAPSTPSAPSAPSGSDEVYALSMSHHDPSTTVNAKAIEEWVANVDAATGGRVKITIHAGAVLGAPNDGLDMLEKGVCDVLWTTTGFFSGQFPYTEIFQVPMLGISSSVQGTDLFWDLSEQFPLAYGPEYDAYKLLIMYASPTSVIGTNKLIETASDMAGLRLRTVSGPLTEIVQEWGAVPTSMPPNDIYTSMEKNVLDGYLFEWGGIKSFNLTEVISSFLDVQAFVNPLFIMMNKSKWEALPADLQQAIESVSYRDGSMLFAEASQATSDQSIQEVRAAGIPIVTPEGAALQTFQVGADKVAANWISRLTTDTIDAQEIYDTAKELLGS